jgi:hypothetical protein
MNNVPSHVECQQEPREGEHNLVRRSRTDRQFCRPYACPGPLWEIRLKGKAGIARALYVTAKDHKELKP